MTKRKISKTSRRNPIPAIAAVVLFIASLGWGIKSAAPHVLSLANQGSRNSDITKSRLEEEIRWRLEAYRATEGGYPSALGNLKSAGLASDAFLGQVSARSFRYRLTADGRRYTLL